MKAFLLASVSALAVNAAFAATPLTIGINLDKDNRAVTNTALGIDSSNWTTLNTANTATITNGLSGSSLGISFDSSWQANWSFTINTGNAIEDAIYGGMFYNNKASYNQDTTITLSGFDAILSSGLYSGYTVRILASTDEVGKDFSPVGVSSGAVAEQLMYTKDTPSTGMTNASDLLTNDTLTLSFYSDNSIYRYNGGASTGTRGIVSGIIVSFTPIPEPSTYVIGMAALAAGAIFVVRRKKSLH